MALEKIGVEAVIEGLSSFRSGISGMEKDVAGFGTSVKNSLVGIGGVAAKTVVAGMATATAAVAGFAVAGSKAFVGFERGMNEVFTLLPGISEDAMSAMEDQVLELSRTFGTLPEDAIPALYQALSAGVPQDNVFAFLETANKAAIGGVTDLETAVDGITSVTNAYGTEILSAAEASDIMFTAVRLGKTDFNQLSSRLFNVIPTAAALGISFGDVAAQLAVLTGQGTPTSVATTQLRAAFVEASKGGTKLSTAIQQLTGESFTDLIADGKTSTEVFQLVRDSMPEQEFKDLFGSVEALNAALGTTGPNFEKTQAAMDEMTNSSGATEAAFGVMSQGLQMTIDRLKAFGSTALIEIGKSLEPLLRWAADFAEQALPKVQAAIDKTISVISVIIDRVGAFFSNMDEGMSIMDAFIEAIWDIAPPQVLDFLTTMRDSIVELFDGIKSGEDIVGDIANFVWGVALAFGATEEGAKKLFLSVISLRDFFAGDFAAGFAVLWPVVQPYIEQFISDLGDALVSGLKGISAFLGIDIATPIINAFGKLTTVVIPSVIQFVTAVGVNLSQLGRILTPIGQLFVTFGQQIVTAFQSGGIVGAVNSFIQLWPGMVVAVQVAIDQILTFIGQKIGVDLLGIFQNAQLIIGTLFTAISAIVGSVIAAVTPAIQGFVAGFTDAFSSFAPLGESFKELWITLQPIVEVAITVIGGALLGLLSLVTGVFAGIIAAIDPFITTLGFVLNGIVTFVNGAIQLFVGLFSFLQGALAGNEELMLASWQKIKEGVSNIVTGLVEAVAGLWTGLMTTLQTFAQTLVDSVIGFFTNLYDELVGNSIIPDLVNGILSWFNDLIEGSIQFFTDLIEGVLIIVGDGVISILSIVEGFKNDFVDWINELVDEAADEFRKFVKEIEGMASDMKEAGKNIIQGLIDGIKQKVSDAVAAVVGAVSSVVNAAKAAAGVESPSTVFAEIGRNLGLGLIVGIEEVTGDVQKSIVEMFDIGKSLGGIGTSFTKEMERTLFPQMEKRIAGFQGALDTLRERFVENFGEGLGIEDVQNLTHEDLVRAYFAAAHDGNTQMLHDIEQIFDVQNQLSGATAEYTDAQEKILALQKAQKDLAFLEQQQKLLDLITEHGLDASEILNGMQLGLGADTQGLVEAMTRAIQAIVDQTNAQLEIASPSGVFQRIGEFVTSGLTRGIMIGATQPEMAMSSVISRMAQPVQALPSVSLAPQTVTNSRQAQLNFGDTIINNDTDVQAFRDFILRTVRDNI